VSGNLIAKASRRDFSTWQASPTGGAAVTSDAAKGVYGGSLADDIADADGVFASSRFLIVTARDNTRNHDFLVHVKKDVNATVYPGIGFSANVGEPDNDQSRVGVDPTDGSLTEFNGTLVAKTSYEIVVDDDVTYYAVRLTKAMSTSSNNLDLILYPAFWTPAGGTDGTLTGTWTFDLASLHETPTLNEQYLVEGIYQRMRDFPLLVETFLDRVYHAHAPQGENDRPYVTYRVVSDVGVSTLIGETNVRDALVQFDVWSLTEADAQKGASAIVDSFGGFIHGDMGDVAVRESRVRNVLDGWSPPSDGNELGYRRKTIDVAISYLRTAPAFVYD